jgi:DivIVA domain-containing protein
MSDEHDIWWPATLAAATVVTPELIRSRQFGRTPLGRRGLDENDVYDFLDQVADELARRDQREAAARADADRHKRALRDWSQDHAEARNARPTPPGPSVDVVNLMSRTQQDCDQRIRHTQDYCHQLAAEAEQYADNLIAQAQQHAAEAAEQEARNYRAAAGADYSADIEDFRRRLVWIGTFIDSLGAAERQLGAIREAIRYDVDQLHSGLTRDHQHA